MGDSAGGRTRGLTMEFDELLERDVPSAANGLVGNGPGEAPAAGLRGDHGTWPVPREARVGVTADGPLDARPPGDA